MARACAQSHGGCFENPVLATPFAFLYTTLLEDLSFLLFKAEPTPDS
jgi:hypothetical protein